eukprot:4155717-Prymnesium_polylepis.1
MNIYVTCTGNGRYVGHRLHTRVDSDTCGPQATWDCAWRFAFRHGAWPVPSSCESVCALGERSRVRETVPSRMFGTRTRPLARPQAAAAAVEQTAETSAAVEDELLQLDADVQKWRAD